MIFLAPGPLPEHGGAPSSLRAGRVQPKLCYKSPEFRGGTEALSGAGVPTYVVQRSVTGTNPQCRSEIDYNAVRTYL
jgi:hypothetical protein